MKRAVLGIWLIMVMSSCSLFKLSVSVGDTPLSPADLNTRMMTRGFYNEFNDKVVTAADSIIEQSNEFGVKINAMRWKLEATSACAASSFQTVPEVSLLNTWVLCRRMNDMLEITPDSLLFGKLTPIARTTSSKLYYDAEALAQKVLAPERYKQMSEFIDQYCSTRSAKQMRLMPDNLMLEWVQYLGNQGQSLLKTVGSVSEVMADMSDRLSGYSEQLTNKVSWSKDILVLQMEQDSLRSNLTRQLDSTARDFRRMVLILEHSPELIDAVSGQLNKQITALITTMNYSVDNAFINIAQEREALQIFFAEQRQILMAETKTAAESAVQTAMDGLPSLIGRMLMYIIMAVVVAFSLPFLLGMWLGQLRERKKERKRNNDSL